MKIAIIHYHLKPGGVTTVINQQIEAARDDCDLLVLTGALPSSNFQMDHVVIPGLGYDEKDTHNSDPTQVAESVIDAMNEKWGSWCDVLHVHNPILLKNKHFLAILKILQKKEIPLFLQVHDFAEDGRPHSYYKEEYPENCHYGVINSRDYRILLKSGLKKNGLHKISNMVNPLDVNQETQTPENFILYPVRPIRRKNIGEAILLSLYFKNQETLAITLLPNSPMDIASYNDWKTYVELHKLNIEFQASKKRDFLDLVLFSKFIITTSITEGFGFSFLEPWTGGKTLWGRKLPDICIDFQQNDINLDALYTAINTPVDWINRKKLYKKWESSIAAACAKFDISPNMGTMKNAFNSNIKHNCIDFGLLDEVFQKEVIERVRSSRKMAEHLSDLNPFLSNLDITATKSLISQNREAVLNNYSKNVYKKNLLDIYKKVSKKKVFHRINKKILFTEFLNPSGLSLLKWSEYEK